MYAADHGVTTLLGDLKRSRDWVEPPAEGDHILVLTIAGDDTQ